MDGHDGRLFVEGNRHGLAAVVSVDTRYLIVETDGDTWTWPVREVVVQRWQGNQFKLTMGKEEFLFTADDPLTFTFEVVDHLEGETVRTLRRRRPEGKPGAWASRPSLTASFRTAERVPVAASVAPGDVWTELATGRHEATLLEALAELSNADKHSHRLEESDGGADGAVRVCAECKQIFVDLVAAESHTNRDRWTAVE